MTPWLPLHGSGRVRADSILYIYEVENEEVGYALGEWGSCHVFKERAEEVARRLRESGIPLLEYKDSQNGRIWVNLRRVVYVTSAMGSKEGKPRVYVGFDSFQRRNLFCGEGQNYLILDLPLAEVEQALDALDN